MGFSLQKQITSEMFVQHMDFAKYTSGLERNAQFYAATVSQSFYHLYYLNVHSFHSALTAKLGPVHGVLGPTLMAKLGAYCRVIVFMFFLHIIPINKIKM